MVTATYTVDRVWKDAVNTKHRYALNCKISSATFSADLYVAQQNCNDTNCVTVHLQSVVTVVEGMQLEPNDTQLL